MIVSFFFEVLLSQLKQYRDILRSSDFCDLVERSIPIIDSRWPSKAVKKKFHVLKNSLTFSGSCQNVFSTERAILSCLIENFERDLADQGPSRHSEFIDLIRVYACLASMIMHLHLSRNAELELTINNTRRRRTTYSSYPTSPMIGQIAAQYVYGHLLENGLSSGKTINVCDPTIEGAPLLWEFLFNHLTHCELSGDRTGKAEPLSNIRIHAFDKNPISTLFFEHLLEKASQRLPFDGIEFNIVNKESLAGMQSLPDFQAVVNNPPWGRSTDKSNELPLDEFGPYRGYRDPYIAFVSVSLKKLEDGCPFAFVLPYQVLNAPSASCLRAEINRLTSIDMVVELPEKCFPRATLKTVLILGHRSESRAQRSFFFFTFDRDRERQVSKNIVLISETVKNETKGLSAPWLLDRKKDGTRATSSRKLGTAVRVLTGMEPYGVGKGRPKQTSQTVREQKFTFDQPGDDRFPVVRGRSVHRYFVMEPTEFVQIGRWLAYSGIHAEISLQPRVFVREICSRIGDLSAAIAPLGVVGRRGVLTLECSKEILPEVAVAFLNSSYMQKQVPKLSAGFHRESFNRITVGSIQSAVIPIALFSKCCGKEGSDLRARIRRLVEDITKTAQAPGSKEEAELLSLLREAVEISKCDTR